MVELFTQYDIHTYRHTWFIYIHKQTLTHSLLSGLRFSVSFIVHFLLSGQLLPIWRHTNETPHCHGNTEGVKSRGRGDEKGWQGEKKGHSRVFKVECVAEIAEWADVSAFNRCEIMSETDGQYWKMWLIVVRTFLCSQLSISFLRAHTSPTHLIKSSSNHPKICMNQSQDFSGSDLFSVREINHETRRLF